MFTSSALSTPRFTPDRNGWGSPKRMSETSVAIIEPPQPSARAARAAAMRMCSRVVVGADVGGVHAGDDFAVDAAGNRAFGGPVLLLLLRGPLDVGQHALLVAEFGQQELGQRPWRSSASLRPSQAMPYSVGQARAASRGP